MSDVEMATYAFTSATSLTVQIRFGSTYERFERMELHQLNDNQ